MLKNKLWIVALIAALTMAFIGCTDAGNYEEPEKPVVMVEQRIELGGVGFKGGQPGNQQGWYSIGYDDDGLLGTPTATVKQFVEAEYLVAKLKTVPGSISGETAEVQVIWGGDGDGWVSGKNIKVSTAAGSPIRWDNAKSELWVKLGDETMGRYADYQALKVGARLVLQSWQATWDFETGFLVQMVPAGEEETGETAVPNIYQIPEAQSDDEDEPYYEDPDTTDIENVFYLNLNDYRTKGVQRTGTAEGSDALVEGDLTANDITVKFVQENQSVHFKLSGAQADKVWEADSAKVTIKLATGSATGTVRYTFTDPQKSGDWNAGTLPSALNGTAQEITFNSNKNGDSVAFLSIQLRQATAVNLKIEYIKVEVIRKEFSGALTAEEVGGSNSGIYFAKYTGPEQVNYTWTRNGTVIGTTPMITIPSSVAGKYVVTIRAFGYVPKTVEVDVVCPCMTSGDPADCTCVPEECKCPACNVWSTIQAGVTVIANLDNIYGLMKGGSFSVGTTSTGALFVFDRVESWGPGVDLQIKTTAGTVEAWEVGIDPAKYYKLVVTGKAQGGVKMKVFQGNAPNTTFAEQTLTGTNAEIKDFTLTVTNAAGSTTDPLLGSDLLAQGVRISTEGTPKAFFLIETVVLQELTGEDGTVAATLINFPGPKPSNP
jgi:hypothetical protein